MRLNLLDDMAESNTRVKIDPQTGSIEVVGSEAFITKILERYGPKQGQETQKKPPEKPQAPDSVKKSSGKGGARSNVVSRAVDGLIDSGFLNEFKSSEEVLAELKRLTTTGAKKSNVEAALVRRVPSKLDRIQEDGWKYRKKA